MDITVFYAWQDDRPGKYSRRLIHDAAEQACRRISQDPAEDWQVRLDQDTAGRPGMCDIPNEILQKIRACDILLADLTFVGSSDAETKHSKRISNPNVLMELGYAVGCKATGESDGFDRVIGVMNVAYGGPEDQMFDIKRRHPIRFNVPEAATKDTVKQQAEVLSKDIEHALRTILKETVVRVRAESGERRFRAIRDQFEASVRDGSFHGLYKESAAITVILVPDGPASIDHSRLQQLNIRPPGVVVGSREPRGKSVLFVYERGATDGSEQKQVRCSITEATVEGVIRGADTFLLDSQWYPHRPKLGQIIPSKSFEQTVVKTVVAYSAALKDLGVPLPWRLGVSLLGIRGYRLFADEECVAREISDRDDLIADPIVIRRFEDVSDVKSAARLLKGCFDYVGREYGLPGSYNYDSKDDWLGPWS